MSLRDTLVRHVEPLASGLGSLALRGIVRLVTESTRSRQLQVTTRTGDPPDDEWQREALGFTSRPVIGAECVVLRLGGAADHGAVIVVWDNRVRPTDSDEGESGIYDSGPALAVPTTQQRIRLRPGVGVEVTAPYGMDVTGALSGTTVRSGDGYTGTFLEPDTGKTLTFAGGVCTGIA